MDRLDEPVGFPVLHQHLVVLVRRYQEQDGRHTVKTLEPLRSLRPLPSNINKLEWNLLDDDIVLYDAFGRFPRV